MFSRLLLHSRNVGCLKDLSGNAASKTVHVVHILTSAAGAAAAFLLRAYIYQDESAAPKNLLQVRPSDLVWSFLLCGIALQCLIPDHSGLDLFQATQSPDGSKQAGPGWKCKRRGRGQLQHRSACISVPRAPVLAGKGGSQSCSGRPQHRRLALLGIQSTQLPAGGTLIISPAVTDCADTPGLEHSTAACQCQLTLGASPLQLCVTADSVWLLIVQLTALLR